MALQEWELQQYRAAAAEVIRRLGGDPNEQVLFPDGNIHPLWMGTAVKMHELRLMQEAMRVYGPYGPP
jgi:hypothetical protein